MKIKRFVAQDMRQAIRMVREALGEDAVILSNRSVDEGVELTAAVDLPDSHEETDSEPAAAPTQRRRAAPGQGPAMARRPSAGRRQGRVERASATAPVAPRPADPDALAGMQDELHKLRRWMQAELSSMSWHDLGQRAPHTRELIGRLMGLGLSGDIARGLAERTADQPDPEQAWSKALYHLAGELGVLDTDYLDRGGVIAVVGPTGVGKTTTIAKLAARFALRHGHRQVALITTDNYRVAARDQLQTYGRILNVPIHAAGSATEMEDALDALSERRLILVDSAGMGGDDERLVQQLDVLAAAGEEMTTLLALAATTESASLSRAVRLFEAARPDACVLTKVDEAASLGGAISSLIHSGLPLSFLCDGQRVPEDLHLVRAHPLVTRAAELMKANANQADATYVPLAYGMVNDNARI